MYFKQALMVSAATLNMYFTGNRDYARDPIIKGLMTKGLGTHKLKARTGFYRQAMDQINKQHSMLPISSLPIVYAHSKAVGVEKNLVWAKDIHISDFVWK
jgi:hypothetical protein